MMLESSRYDKWAGGGGTVPGGGGGGGPSGGSWAGRDRERDRERERQARAHQMSQAPEPDASSLFPAPFRVTGNKDRVSQQIQIKLGDYHLAQTLLDDPSKSIGICAEPPSPAPCVPSRRESEFKKPAHAPQNGRVHHRPYYNKNEVAASTTTPAHRPPPLRIPNGYQHQNASDSSQQQPRIESILKEMKSLPTPVSVIAATPRKELDNKFIFNPYTNKVQENPQLTSNDLKTPITKPGLDNRISDTRSPVSPDVVGKDLGLSESDDENAASTTRLHPILSPIGSGGSPSSGSESSASDSESESSSTESSVAAAPPAPAPAPAQRSSWSLSNFAPPPAPASQPHQTYDSEKELAHALADVKGKPTMDPELIKLLIGTLQTAINVNQDNVQDKWVQLALLKTNLRRGLFEMQRNIDSYVPWHERSRVMGQFSKFKDSLWQAVGALHGDMSRMVIESPISELSDSESSSPSPESGSAGDRRRRSLAKRQYPISDDDNSSTRTSTSPRVPGAAPAKRGRPPKARTTTPPTDDQPPKKRRGRPKKIRPASPGPLRGVSPDSDPPPPPAPPVVASAVSMDTKTHIFRKVFTPKKGDEGGGKGGKGGKGKGGKGKGQVTIIEVTPESGGDDDRRHLERSDEKRRNDEAIAARLSPPHDVDIPRRRDERNERTERNSSIPTTEKTTLSNERIPPDRPTDRIGPTDRSRPNDRIPSDRLPERLPNERIPERIPTERMSVIPNDRLPNDRLPERLPSDRLSSDRLPSDRLSVRDKLPAVERYVKAEADVGSGLVKSERGSERIVEPCSVERRRGAGQRRVMVRIPLLRLSPETLAHIQRGGKKAQVAVKRSVEPTEQSVEAAMAGAAGACGQTPIYYSYFERLPADALSDEERDHKYYLSEATRLRTSAEREQEPLQRVMLYLESVLCFVLCGRVLELDLDTKQAFTIYRETIEYIKSIHSLPSRYRADPHSTFTKLDILSLRVQALLYLRMFKMYNREVKEYYKIVQEYQQKPAHAESVSPLSPRASPSPSPAGSASGGSVGSGGGGSGGSGGSVGSAGSSGCSSLAHAVPAHAHNALLQLTKYYTFLYVAHELWEQADCLCRLRPNQDLFIAVDRKCGPLTLFSTFRHLVQYVRYAISLLKHAPRD